MGSDGTTQLRARIGEVAAAEGALVTVDVASRSRGNLRALPRDEADIVLAGLVSTLQAAMPTATWLRRAWTRHESVLVGSRADLSELARGAVGRLASNPLAWILTLTRIMPGEPERTLCCDANYDLVKLTTTSAVWVEPYPDDDWRESQRYPSVEVIAQSTPTGPDGD